MYLDRINTIICITIVIFLVSLTIPAPIILISKKNPSLCCVNCKK